MIIFSFGTGKQLIVFEFYFLEFFLNSFLLRKNFGRRWPFINDCFKKIGKKDKLLKNNSL